MSKYVCNNCKKDFKQKSNYENHTKFRKKPCLPTENKITKLEKLVKPVNEPNKTENSILNKLREILDSDKYSHLKNLYSENNNTLKCEYCYNNFSRRDYLNLHKKKYCKTRKELEMKDLKMNNLNNTTIDIKQYKELLEENSKLVKILQECKEYIDEIF